MALDLAVLGATGQPEVEAPLGADDHAHLLSLARKLGLVLLLRMQDYYKDAEYAPSELPGLKAEVRRAMSETDEQGRHVLRRIDELIAEAERRGNSVVAIAD